MAHQTKDGVWAQVVYFGVDDKSFRRIERAAKLQNRSISEFMLLASDRAAVEALEERKRLAAERQLGEVSPV